MGGVRGLLADGVVFHQPGRNPLSGEYRGIDSVLGLLGELGNRSEGTFRADVHDVIANDQHAVGLLTISAERQGRRLENHPVVHVFHVRDGKLTELWVHPQDQNEVDEFWS